MALLDDLVQFVSDNTLGGSWQKPQLRQRCEKFLEDADIGGGGGMPDKVTMAMMESVEWPTLLGLTDETTMVAYFEGENVDEVLGAGENYSVEDCSYKVRLNLDGNEGMFICTEADESVTYINEDKNSFPKTIAISRHDYVLLDLGEGPQGEPFLLELIYESDCDRYFTHDIT